MNTKLKNTNSYIKVRNIERSLEAAFIVLAISSRIVVYHLHSSFFLRDSLAFFRYMFSFYLVL